MGMAPEEIRQTLTALAAGPPALARLIRRHPADAFDRRDPQGGWTGREIVAHLADLEFNLHFTARVARVLSEERPALCAAETDWRALEHRHGHQDPRVALGAYTLARKHMLGILAGLPSAAWDRVGLHPEAGPRTLLQLAQGFVRHDRRHIARLQELLEAGAGAPG